MQVYFYATPIGKVRISAEEEYIRALEFVEEEEVKVNPKKVSNTILQCLTELDEYFTGIRKDFSIKVAQDGTQFQKKAWEALTKIPYGEVRSYAWEAEMLGRPKAVRAVGSANGANNLIIVVPCHRVVASSGAISGYGAGVWRKEWLLAHEKKHCSRLSS